MQSNWNGDWAWRGGVLSLDNLPAKTGSGRNRPWLLSAGRKSGEERAVGTALRPLPSLLIRYKQRK